MTYAILGVVWLALLSFLLLQSQQTQQRFIEKNIQTQDIAWQAVQKIHLKGIEAHYESLINTPDVVRILRLAQSPNLSAIARHQLYQTLRPLQEKLRAQGINVFHFHTPTNQSFLRFHQPDKYGDDLSTVRLSIARANSTLTAIHGFETGRVESGFRHVFPIVVQGEHLGSVELSQSFEPLRNEMQALDHRGQFSLIQKATAVRDKNFSEYSALFFPSLFSNDWLEQASPNPTQVPAGLLANIKKDHLLKSQLNQHKTFARLYSYNGQYVLVTFSAVKDIENRINAYLVSIKPAPEMQANAQNFWLYALISTLILLLLGTAIHQTRLSNRAKIETTHYLESLYNTMTEGLYATDMHGNITEVNNAALRILGYTKPNLIGQNAHQLFHNPLQHKHHVCPLEIAIESNTAFEGELAFLHASGKSFAVHVSSQPLHLHQTLVGAVVVFHDISHTKKAQDALRVAATAFESQDGIMITNAKGIILRVNQSFTRLTGYLADEVIGLTPAVLNSGKQTPQFYADLWSSLQTKHFWQGEIWNRRKDGTTYLEWLTVTAVLDNDLNITQYVANFSDITESHQNRDKIEKLAFYDPLTHLPNRRLLWDRLELALQKSARSQEFGVVFFIDLDNFKTLNDSKGHRMGDLLLIEVARRLKNAVREVDTVARIGGDEFVVLMESIGTDPIEASLLAEEIAHKILNAFETDFILENITHHSSPSIGIDLFSPKETSAEAVIMHADMAMYEAKKQGRNTVRFFSADMQVKMENHAAMLADLRKAVGQNEFTLYYQPQVNQHNQTHSCEALIRWQHPQKGLISPAEFIPIAEESNLILALGEFVIHQACSQLLIWHEHPSLCHVQIAINVSPKQFAHEQFVPNLLKTLRETGINPACLKLELTESLAIKNIEQTIQTMQKLRKMGIQFSMDDFGTGYSSLSVIKQLPLAQVKIDQSFVRGLGHERNQENVTIVQTILAMAKALKLEVIAEGVETEQQRQILLEQGCTLYQGYLFSKPLPINEFETFFNAQLPKIDVTRPG